MWRRLFLYRCAHCYGVHSTGQSKHQKFTVIGFADVNNRLPS